MQRPGQGQNRNRNKKRGHGGRGGPRRDHQPPQQQGRHNRNDQGQHKNNGSGGDRAQQQRQNGQQQPPANSKYGRVVENHIPKRYGIAFFDTFAQAKADMPALAEKAKTCDQLNIVIKAEGDMTDPELKQFGVVFAGTAWHLIHTRRVDEGWYNEPR